MPVPPPPPALPRQARSRAGALRWLAAGLAVAARVAAGEPAPTGPARDREPIKPIPLGQVFDAQKMALGKALFYDPRLSRDNTISCASCHDLAKAGMDGRARSLGIGQAVGTINTPSVFNSGLNFRQFWDGRAATLEEQMDGPLQNAVEMGTSWPEVLKKLSVIPEYTSTFTRLYPGGLTQASIRDAIAVFQRSLLTPGARFDKYLRGADDAISADEKEGYARFKAYGCASCHQGVNVGGNMFEPLGAMADYFAERGGVTTADYGRFNVTGRETDRFVFKVPSLRNVARTAPYFHDGSTARLEDAVEMMGRFQLGRTLSAEDIALLVKFLGTLTGEYEGKPL